MWCRFVVSTKRGWGSEVTTPPLKGGGFSLNRLVLAKAQPEPKNVTCRVRVSVSSIPTRHTTVSSHHYAGKLRDVPAMLRYTNRNDPATFVPTTWFASLWDICGSGKRDSSPHPPPLFFLSRTLTLCEPTIFSIPLLSVLFRGWLATLFGLLLVTDQVFLVYMSCVELSRHIRVSPNSPVA